jgi:Zn-dependent protease/CBS domain-containing protein
MNVPPSSARSDPPVEALPTRGAQSFRRGVPTPKWSWKLTRVFGIDVYVHQTFFLLVAFVAFSSLLGGQGLRAMLGGLLLLIAVFASVVVHEFGHALMARRFGVRTWDITLLPIGGVARFEKMPERPSEQLSVALAGPAMNVAIALLLFVVVSVLGLRSGVDSIGLAGGSFLAQLMWLNLVLAGFNLLPGYPMDGGRVLRALLAMRMAPELATQTAARVGQGVAVAFGLVGLFLSPFLVLIAVFVWLGAQAEHTSSAVKVALRGLSVREGMITDFQSVSPRDPLSRAVQLTLAGFQQDFPVVEGERLLGVLSHSALLKGLSEGGADIPVLQVMGGEPDTASPDDGLDTVLSRMHTCGIRALVVMDHQEIVGLLTVGNIGELLAFEAAGRRFDPALVGTDPG